MPVARLSGGQRQAIAVARTISGDADIILLDEPLAAMGAKEGAMILDLIARLKEEGNVSIIMILHNYVHVLTGMRSGQPDPGRRHRAGQADGGDVGRGADRHRRRGVPPGAAAGTGRQWCRRPAASRRAPDERAVQARERSARARRTSARRRTRRSAPGASSERVCTIGSTSAPNPAALCSRSAQRRAARRQRGPYASGGDRLRAPFDGRAPAAPTGRSRTPTTGSR